MRWWRQRGPGWRLSLAVNAAGAVTTAAVLVIVAVTKFAAGDALFSIGGFEVHGGAWMVLVLIPVLVTELCALRVERAQPRNLFVYIFFCGFFPAALATLLTLLGGLGLLWLDGLFPMPPWLDDFAGYLWLVMFPEAFINGTVVTALVVFYPDWLETFNRSRYLQAPWKEDERDE